MTQKTVEEKIRVVNDQLMLVLAEDPNVDWALLKDLTGGLVQKGAEPGNGMEQAKIFYRYNRRLLETQAAPTPKRRGRKPKADAKAETGSEGTSATPAKKRRGRPPKNAAAAATPPAPENPPAQ
jgi:hypothetical protein